MAEKQIIAATLQVDTGNSNANIKEVNKNTTELNSNLKDTGAAASDAGKSVEESTGSFGKLKSQMSALPGPLGAAGSGVSKLSAAFKALLLNPVVLVITAIVGALALLYKAFTSTNEGADKMEQVFAGIGATINVIRDRILKIAGAIAKFFSGDFKGALEEGRAAVSGIGEEISREFQAAANATKVLQDLGDELRNLTVSRAKLNRDLRVAKELINDDTASSKERKKAIDEVREAEGAQSAQELENAKKKLAAIQAKNNLSDKSDEALQEEADAQAAIYNIEAQSAADRDRLNKQYHAIERADKAKANEADKRLQDEKLKRINELKEAEKQELENRKAITNGWLQYVESIKSLSKQQDEAAKAKAEEDAKFLSDQYEQQTKLDNEYTARVIQNNKDQQRADEAVAENKLKTYQIISDAANGLSDLIGRQTVVGKALAVASTIINTYEAAWSVFKNASKNPASIPFPAYPYIQAGIAIAAGLKTVSAIVKTKVPGSGGGGASVSAPSLSAPAAPIAPQVQTTSLNQGTLNQIGNSTVRAYLVDSDVANNQERNTRLNRQARLGG